MLLSPSLRFVFLVTFLSTITSACGSRHTQNDHPSDSAGRDLAGSEDSLVIELAGIDSATVLELLQREYEVECRRTAAGSFVTSIGSVASSAEYFWLFSINDTFPTAACDRCVVSQGDRVRWHFRRVGR